MLQSMTVSQSYFVYALIRMSSTIDDCIDAEKLTKSFKVGPCMYIRDTPGWQWLVPIDLEMPETTRLSSRFWWPSSPNGSKIFAIYDISTVSAFSQCTTARRHPRKFQASSPLSSRPEFSTWSDCRWDQWGVETRLKPTAECQALFHGTDRWPDHAFVPSCMYLRQLSDRLCIGPIVTVDAAIGKFLCSSSASCNRHFLVR